MIKQVWILHKKDKCLFAATKVQLYILCWLIVEACKHKYCVLAPAAHFTLSFPFLWIRSVEAGRKYCLWIRPNPSIINVLTLMLKYCLFGLCCGGSHDIRLYIDARHFYDNLWEMRNCKESLLSLLKFSVLIILTEAAPVIKWPIWEDLKPERI